MLERVPAGMDFDPVEYVQETLSRVGYVCEINFDPLVRRYLFRVIVSSNVRNEV